MIDIIGQLIAAIEKVEKKMSNEFENLNSRLTRLEGILSPELTRTASLEKRMTTLEGGTTRVPHDMYGSGPQRIDPVMPIHYVQ